MTTTVKESIEQLCAMQTTLAGIESRKAEADENLDSDAVSVCDAEREALMEAAHQLALTFSDIAKIERMPSLIRAVGKLKPKQVKMLLEATRVNTVDGGIYLPLGRYEHCSRGKGWCRLGSGSSVTWGERTDKGYFADQVGKWVVGSDDGFSRKDKTEWKVEQLADNVWIAN
jgi:hypothetical protein